jgi:uncharacterized membrane protein SirB2
VGGSSAQSAGHGQRSPGGVSALIEFYPEIRWVHIAAALASGSLLLIRGLALRFGVPAATAAPWYYLCYTIDIVLLSAALMLASLLHRVPFADPWVTAKIALIACYLLVGTLVFRSGISRRAQSAFLAAAMILFLMLITVARSRGAAFWL